METVYVLSRFEGGKVNPLESFTLCAPHYKRAEEAGETKGYDVAINHSSTPSTWCRDCNPKLNTAEAHGY